MKRVPDLVLAVHREPPVDHAQRTVAEIELGRRMAEAQTLLFRGDPAGADVLFEGIREHLRRLPHADPHLQARALRGLARLWELSRPVDAMALYREALALNPQITDVKERLAALEAALVRVRGEAISGRRSTTSSAE